MIVQVDHSHLKSIANIEKKSFENPWSYNAFSNEINSKISSNWVYIINNNVIGYMFGWIIDKDFHINNIAVDASERRKGVAKKMIDNIIFNLNMKNILLEVSRLNKDAINLYEKIGFKKNGLRKGYYRNGADAILYKMKIK
tara:strand:+ start:329 stop:751 length:423 start_codon:yes stop_codon:yes gene_type:complete